MPSNSELAKTCFLLACGLGIPLLLFVPLPAVPTRIWNDKFKFDTVSQVNSSFDTGASAEANNLTFQRYVVISSAIPHNGSDRMTRSRFLGFLFYLPLTSLSWRRLGYLPVIYIVGKKSDWNTIPVLQVVRDECKRVGARVIIIENNSRYQITITQVIRLYASSTDFFQNKDGFILTSDADLWPIHTSLFTQSCTGHEDTHITVYNYKCCGFIKETDNVKRIIRHLPMSNIGMTRDTWRQVMKLDPKTVIRTANDILEHLTSNNITLSGEDGKRKTFIWFVDQRLISRRIYEYLNENTMVSFLGKMPYPRHRLDRSNWYVPETLEGVVDAHLPSPAYREDIWLAVRPLLELLFSDEELQKCDSYRSAFLYSIDLSFM